VYPVYTWASQTWWQDKPLYTTAADSHNYRYSPTFAVAFTPFARLPEQVGSSLWCLLNVGVLFLSLRAIAGYALPRVRAEHRDAGFMALALLGSVSGLWSSQANSLIIALTLLAGAALLRQRWWLAALLLTVSAYIKVWPLAVALLLATCWPRPLIWRMAVLMVALAAIPFLTRPPSVVIWQYQEWWGKLAESQVHDRGPLYPGFWTLGERLGMVFSDGVQRLIQAATALLVFIACLWQRRRLLKDSAGRLLMGVISLWASWQLLFGPGTERITYGLVAPSLAWAVVTSREEHRGRAWMTATWLLLAAFGCGDIERVLVHALPPATVLLPLGVILFVGWLIWHESSASPAPRCADAFAAARGVSASSQGSYPQRI
jgi:hypothetical protein